MRYDRYGRAAPALIIEQEWALHEIVPTPQPSARNRRTNEEVVETGPFWGGVTKANLGDVMAAYVPGDAARKLRERLTEDVDMRTHSTRTRRRNHQQWGERVGDALEYDRFARGVTREQNFWERHERHERPHMGTLVMYSNIGISAGQRETDLEMSGAVALALIDLLEGIGYRVELFGVMSSAYGYGGTRIDQRFRLKDADDRLSSQAMAVVCKGGVTRRIVIDTLDWRDDVTTPRGHGTPCNYAGTHEADIVVPQKITTEDAAIKWIDEQVAKFTTEAREA